MEHRSIGLFIVVISLASLLKAEGPKFTHKDPVEQQEFESVYQDLRRINAKAGSYVNVKDYGAHGDGTFDDTTAIQAAINYAQQRPSKAVLFPGGTYRCTSTIYISSSTRLLGAGGMVESNDSDYFHKSGAPNDHYGPATILWFDFQSSTCVLLQQRPAGASSYKMQVSIEDMFFAGPGQSSGTTDGHGIVVDSKNVNFAIRCYFRNVSVSNFSGYGIYLKEGYYGSKFDYISTWFSGLTGFYTTGTSQGEWELNHLRSFGCGLRGTTEKDQAGMYIGSGSGISLNRISCSGWRVHAYLNASLVMNDYQAESFGDTNSTSLRSLIIEACHPVINGLYLSPNGSFQGRVLDFRSATNATIFGMHLFSSLDPTGYDVYEDTNSGSNLIVYSTLGGPTQTQLQPGTRFEGGTDFLVHNSSFYPVAFFSTGTLAAPSIAWTGDPTTGIFKGGTGRIDFSNQGLNTLTATTSGIGMLWTDGTLSTLGMQFANDLDTGFYRAAPNCVEHVTNGAKRFEVCQTSVTVQSGTTLYGDGSGLTGVNASSFSGNYVANAQTSAPLTGGSAGSSGASLTLGVDGSSVTLQGNTFNAASKLLQLTSGALVSNTLLDTSSVTKMGNLFNYVATISTNASTIGGVTGTHGTAITIAVDPSSGTLQGNTFNAASKLLQLDTNARVPAAQMPALTGDVTTTAGNVATTVGSFNVAAGTSTKISVSTIQYSGADIVYVSTSGAEIKGTPNNSTPPTGFKGEVIESVIGFTNAPAQNTLGDLTSISLSPGRWMVSANVFWLRNSATYTAVDLEIAITSTSGNSSAGIVNGSNNAEFAPGSSALLTWGDVPEAIPCYIVYVPSGPNVTYYLKYYPGGYSGGTPQAAGRLTAVRF